MQVNLLAMRFTFKLFLTLLTAVFAFSTSYATHNMGKDMRYTCLGLVNGQMQYKVTVVYYRNCWDNGQAASAPSAVSLEARDAASFFLNASLRLDTLAVPANGSEIEQICASQASLNGCNWSGAGNPTYPGVQVYTYTGIISVPDTCKNIILGTTDCCRNGAVNNIASAGSLDLSLVATINNAIDPNTGLPYANNSARFNALPIIFYCTNSNVTYNHSSVDIDGDSLVYSMVNSMEGATLPYANIPFLSGYSVTNPVSTSGPFNFDARTGQMNFIPNNQEQDVMAVRVDEYRKGVLVGSTMRDIQFVVFNCAVSNPVISNIKNLQNGYLADSTTVEVCPGGTVQLDILCTDPNNRNLTINSSINSIPSAIPGAMLTTTGTGNAVTAQLQWTPQLSDTGLHYLVVSAINDDCPVLGRANKAFAINVVSKGHLLADTRSYCGQPVQLNAFGAGNLKWWPTEGLSDTTILHPLATPAVPTVYHFQSDCGTDSVFVNVSYPFNLDLGNDTTLCSSDSVKLLARATVNISSQNYQWYSNWHLAGFNSGNTLLARINESTTFYCAATDSAGCTVRDSIRVTYNVYNKVELIASDNNVCAGDTVKLNALLVVSDEPCGLSAGSCISPSFTAQVGNGTALMPSGSPSTYPALYGKYRRGVRTQILYTKADLLQMLGGAAQLSGLAFEIANLLSASPLENFEIKIACTQATSLTTWQGNLSSVYSDSSYTPVSGWNYHSFNHAYNWDGNSNLVVDICTYNPTGTFTINNRVRGANATYQSVFYSTGSTIQCGVTGTPLSSSFLPNIKLDYCRKTFTGNNAVWSSALQPSAIFDTTALTPVFVSTSTNTYYFNVADSACLAANNDSITVVVAAIPIIDSINVQNALCNTFTGSACAYVSGNGGFQYSWNANAQPSSLRCNAALPPGNNTVTVTDTRGCRADSIFNVNNTSISHAASFALYADSSTAHNWFAISQVSDTSADYLWEWGDGTTSTGQYPSHIYAAPGFYNICLTVSDGVLCPTTYCDSSTYLYKNEEEQTMVSVNVVSQLPAYTGISEKYESPVWSVYPVPASDRINVNTGGKVIERVHLYNHVGRLMLESINPVGNDFNVKDFAPGVYIAEVKAGGLTSRGRWVKL